MMKTLDLIQQIVRNTKHPFPQTVSRPAKNQKNRYERRKIREFLHLRDWTGETDVPKERFDKRVRPPRERLVFSGLP
jgi:hypothetical protein